MEGRAPGIYLGLSNEEYHADPAVGSSGIKLLCERPARYHAARHPFVPKFKPRTPAKEGIAKKFGSAYHTLMLEPDQFDKRYRVKFGVDQSGMVGTLGEGEWERMQAMKARLLSNPRRAQLLMDGISEVSYFWRDEATGIMCKVRYDRFAPAWVLDLKTTRSVITHALDSEMRKLSWDISGAMYSIAANDLKKQIRAGYEMPPEFSEEFISTFLNYDNQLFVFLVQEKEPPFLARAKVLTPYHAACGRDDFRRGLKLLQQGDALAADDYPDIEEM